VARSVCPYCAVGCGQRVFVKDGAVTQIEGDPDSPISRGRAELPLLFAGSSLASAGGLGLVAVGPDDAGPARRLAVAGAVLEFAARGSGLRTEPYRVGRAGRLMRLSRLLTGAGAAGAMLGRRNRTTSVLSGTALLGGSLAARFGVFEAGKSSTLDPKYALTVQ